MITRNIQVSCAICGESDPRVLKQQHHVFGRTNGTETIWLCHNCHDKITYDQNQLSPKVRSRNATFDDKKALEDVSIGSLLELLGDQMKKRGLGKRGNSS
jgi:RecJ-like exonuclease